MEEEDEEPPGGLILCLLTLGPFILPRQAWSV
jgi:hypothetical protein